jgi:hypothetical protein
MNQFNMEISQLFVSTPSGVLFTCVKIKGYTKKLNAVKICITYKSNKKGWY